ncbi:MAG: DUF6600 domain-containing protein [Verrucomicrobiota bacterium]
MKILTILGLLAIMGARPYAERGTIDFDAVYDALQTHGTWEEIEKNIYAFKPHDAFAPYREGKWMYTDFGWMWMGVNSASWAIEHYGVWKQKDSGEWLWLPDDKWWPAPVQWRVSGDYVGWRPCVLDASGFPNPQGTSLNPAEWNFVRRKKLAGALKSSDFVDFETAKSLLEKSEPLQHTFKAWRDIDRPGPEPSSIHPKITIFTIRNIPSPEIQPTEFEPTDVFICRPKFHQDEDGIHKRVQIRLDRTKNPSTSSEADQKDTHQLQKVMETLEIPPPDSKNPAH